jgi:hypothetical protein
MGFTYVPKKIDYSINPKWTWGFLTIAEANADFIFDVGVGLRLPIRVDITAPNPDTMVSVGGQNNFTTSITPLDFTAQDYERLGIPAEDGHEFFAREKLLFELKAWFLGLSLVDYKLGSDLDMGKACQTKLGINCQDFVTPFGSDEYGVPRKFPIPSVDFSPEETGIKYSLVKNIEIGLGLRIEPQLGSDMITSEWVSANHPAVRGSITYEVAYPAQYSFGGELTNGIGVTHLENKEVIMLDNYKFHLNRQVIALLGNLHFEFFGHDVYQTRYLKIVDFNFSSIFGEPVLAQHRGSPGVVFSWDRTPISEINATMVKPAIVKVANASDANSTLLTVSTDKATYSQGETVIISGHTSNATQQILLQVFNPKGAAYRFDLISGPSITADGHFKYLLKIGGKLGSSGIYKIILSESGQRAETAFSFN